MNDYTFSNLTTAVSGFNSAVAFQVQSLDPYDISTTNGTVPLGNFNFEFSAVPGWLTGRRPVNGQLFPRGVYNK